MAGQAFDYGLFGDGNSTPNQTPETPYSQSFQNFGSGMGYAASAIHAAGTRNLQEDPFAGLTKIVKNHQRMSAIKAANANGLTPDQGDKYYSFIRDRLIEDGDMEGAEKVEGKRSQAAQIKIDQDYKIAATEGTKTDTRLKTQELDSNAPERKLKVAEAGVTNDAERTGVMKQQAALDERKQKFAEDHWESPEEKWKYTERELGLKYDFENKLQDKKYNYDLNVANAKAGIPKDMTNSDAVMGQKMWLGNMQKYRATDKDPGATSIMKQWETHSGMKYDDIVDGLKAPKTSEKRVAAEIALGKIGIETGTSYKQLKAEYPRADPLQLWNKAIEAPVGARLMYGKDNKPVWRMPDGTYYRADTTGLE